MTPTWVGALGTCRSDWLRGRASPTTKVGIEGVFPAGRVVEHIAFFFFFLIYK